MIDQYAMFVNEDGRSSLGDWIKRQREKNLFTKYNQAKKVIRQCGIHVNELRHEWEQQKAAQKSIRARKLVCRQRPLPYHVPP